MCAGIYFCVMLLLSLLLTVETLDVQYNMFTVTLREFDDVGMFVCNL